MKHIIFTFLFLFFFFLPEKTYAQQVKGRLYSEDKQPVDFAAIYICRMDSSVVFSLSTDSKGRFSEKVNLDEYFLFIQAVGFHDKRIGLMNYNKNNLDLGDIILVYDAVNLNEVTVIPDRLTEYVDRTIVIPSVQEYKASVNGLDLLANLQLPGVFVDRINQSASIGGTSGTVYKINGIKVSHQEVLALRAEQIVRVEYSQIPSGRELSDNSGVINFILKREQPGTFLSGSALSAIKTGFVNANATAKTVFDRSEISLNYAVNYRDYTQRSSDGEYYYQFPDSLIALSQKGENAPFGYTSHQVDLGYIYRTSADIFSLRFQNSIYNSFDETRMESYAAEKAEWLYKREVSSGTKLYSPALDLYYIRNIGKNQGLEINMVGSLTDNDYERVLTDFYPAAEDYRINNSTTEKKKSFILEGFYYNTRNKKVGYDMGIKSSNNFTSNTQDGNKANLRRIDINPYFTLKGRINRFSYQLATGLKIQNLGNGEDTKTYFRNASTFTVTFRPNSRMSLRNTIRYNSRTPSLSQMKEREVRQNDLLVVRGNAALKPYETLSEKITFTFQPVKKIRHETSLLLSKTFNPVNHHYFYDNQLNSIVMQPVNQTYNKYQTLATNIQLLSLFDFLTASAGGEWNRYQTRGEGFDLEMDNITWSVFLTAVYKSFSLHGGYRKPGKSLYGQTIDLDENYSIVSLNYKNRNLSAAVSLFYPNSSGTRYRTELLNTTYRYNRNTTIKDNGNMVCFQVSYYFSTGKPIFNIRKNLQNADTESSILKVGDN